MDYQVITKGGRVLYTYESIEDARLMMAINTRAVAIANENGIIEYKHGYEQKEKAA